MNTDKYRDIPFTKRELCAICKKPLVEPIIKYPSFPLTEIYVDHNISEKIALLIP